MLLGNNNNYWLFTKWLNQILERMKNNLFLSIERLIFCGKIKAKDKNLKTSGSQFQSNLVAAQAKTKSSFFSPKEAKEKAKKNQHTLQATTATAHQKHLHYAPKNSFKLLQATKHSRVYVYISITTFFPSHQPIVLQTDRPSLSFLCVVEFCLSVSRILQKHGTGRVDAVGDGSQRACRCGPGQIGDGPEAHGRAVPKVPLLQRNGPGELYVLALVRWRRGLPDLCRVGSHGVQQMWRDRYGSTHPGSNLYAATERPLLTRPVCAFADFYFQFLYC